MSSLRLMLIPDGVRHMRPVVRFAGPENSARGYESDARPESKSDVQAQLVLCRRRNIGSAIQGTSPDKDDSRPDFPR